jgi:glycosyltransferase involved in cell wall biosynthesis
MPRVLRAARNARRTSLRGFISTQPHDVPVSTFRARPPIVLISAIHTNDDWGFDRPISPRSCQSVIRDDLHTDTEREWLIAHGADPERGRVIGVGSTETNSVPDPAHFEGRRTSRRRYLVAYFGQLASHKGIDVLIRTLPTLVARQPNAWLAVGGSRTPFTNRLEQLCKELPRDVEGGSV